MKLGARERTPTRAREPAQHENVRSGHTVHGADAAAANGGDDGGDDDDGEGAAKAIEKVRTRPSGPPTQKASPRAVKTATIAPKRRAELVRL